MKLKSQKIKIKLITAIFLLLVISVPTFSQNKNDIPKNSKIAVEKREKDLHKKRCS